MIKFCFVLLSLTLMFQLEGNFYSQKGDWAFLVVASKHESACITQNSYAPHVERAKNRVFYRALKQAGEIAINEGCPYFVILKQQDHICATGLAHMYSKYNYSPKTAKNHIYALEIIFRGLKTEEPGAYNSQESVDFKY